MLNYFTLLQHYIRFFVTTPKESKDYLYSALIFLIE